MTGRDVLPGPAPVTEGMLAELDALRAALPGYDVIVTSHSPACRFEATRRRDAGPGPWCVISSDPADLWRELAGPAPPPPYTVTGQTARWPPPTPPSALSPATDSAKTGPHPAKFRPASASSP